MPRPAHVDPWIERLILSYGGEDEDGGVGGVGQLKAHVIGVGELPQSQTTEGPSGLLYLSDGALQIPAVLSAAAWERLQEEEDRECMGSLLHATVLLLERRLLFHAAAQRARCRFFLSIGELATVAVGPARERPPCCTSLPAVQAKISRTWWALQEEQKEKKEQEEQEEELDSQREELSELLGAWQLDCLQEVLDDVTERLMAAVKSPQPSTSACNPPPQLDTLTATSWELDRLRYKHQECFHVPVKWLLIPEDEDTGLQNAAATATASIDDTDWRLPEPAVDQQEVNPSPPPEEDGVLLQDAIAELNHSDVGPSRNPWDVFPPPCGSSSSSEVSPVAMEIPPVPEGVSSFFPPYQKPPPSSSPGNGTETAKSPTLEQKNQPEETKQVKRKRSEEEEEEEVEEEEEAAQTGGSPPSWLFDSPGPGDKDGGGGVQGGAGAVAAATTCRKAPSMHSDGCSFSYSYRTSRRNLQDFTHVTVPDPMLHWAVKYLLGSKVKQV